MKLWVQTGPNPDSGCYEFVEGQPTTWSQMGWHQKVIMAAVLAWQIWTPWWKADIDEPFCAIKLRTAWKIGWRLWGTP